MEVTNLIVSQVPLLGFFILRKLQVVILDSFSQVFDTRFKKTFELGGLEHQIDLQKVLVNLIHGEWLLFKKHLEDPLGALVVIKLTMECFPQQFRVFLPFQKIIGLLNLEMDG